MSRNSVYSPDLFTPVAGSAPKTRVRKPMGPAQLWVIVGRRLPDCPGGGRNHVDRSDLPLKTESRRFSCKPLNWRPRRDLNPRLRRERALPSCKVLKLRNADGYQGRFQ